MRSLVVQVDHGGGAWGSISDPSQFADGGLEWCLRYAPEASNCRLQAASVVATFDYLLSDNITMKEATRRLRQMRKARAALAQETPDE
jgi:hypothetical protein